jgi:hypothetical protein
MPTTPTWAVAGQRFWLSGEYYGFQLPLSELHPKSLGIRSTIWGVFHLIPLASVCIGAHDRLMNTAVKQITGTLYCHTALLTY